MKQRNYAIAGLTVSSIVVLFVCVRWGDTSPIMCGLLAVASNYFCFLMGAQNLLHKATTVCQTKTR